METRFYEMQNADLQKTAEALAYEYQTQGYETQQVGTPEQVLIQLKKESTLRALTGFNKALAVTLQKVPGGMLARVGVQDWIDQIAVGAVGLALHPLLITAAAGALTEYNVVFEILGFIDQYIQAQQPSGLLESPPS